VDEQAGVGVPTLRDIVSELTKPGRDPRAEFREVGFDGRCEQQEEGPNGQVTVSPRESWRAIQESNLWPSAPEPV
jgi:transcriptional accessory protein Tex/SPT6